MAIYRSMAKYHYMMVMHAEARKKHLLMKLLVLERIRLMLRERNYITKECIVKPSQSPWMKIYKDGDDGNFINVVSINRDAFEKLLRVFSRHFHRQWRPGKKGRPPTLIHKHQVLGCVLAYYTDTMSAKTLCQTFGIVPSTLSRTLKLAEEALDRSLSDLSEAKICWPTLDQQRIWGLAVQHKYPLLYGRWGFVDGKNYKVQKPSNSDMQNAMYNGWLHATFVTGCFCFGADGTVCWGKHNVVGSWNDGDISRPFQVKLAKSKKNLPGHGVVADSAFPVSGECYGRIMTCLKENDVENASPDARQGLILIGTQITSARQAAEWGMGAVEKVYRRLLLPLPFNQIRRGLMLRNIYRLYNYRVRTCGISHMNVSSPPEI